MGRNILVKTVTPWTDLDEVEKKGLLVVPDDIKKGNTPLPTTGIVIQLGLGVEPEIQLKPGDMVMFSKFSGTDLILHDETYRLMNVDLVMCTLLAVEVVETVEDVRRTDALAG